MEENTRIYVSRKDGLRAPNVVVKVLVDAKEVCEVRPNGNGQFETTLGEHEVEVKIVRGIRTSKKVTIESGSQIRIKTDLGKIEFDVVTVKYQ